MSGDDVDAEVRAALASETAKAESPAPAPVTSEVQASDVQQALEETSKIDTPAEKSGQPRDEHGRFASSGKETTEPTDSAQPEAAASVEPTVETRPAPDRTGQRQPPIAPPQQWADGAKVKWALLPRAVQEELSKVDAQSQYGQLHDVIEPHREQFAMLGQTPQQAIGNLLTVWQALNRDPAGTVQWLAQQYRLDPTQLFPSASGPAQPGPAAQPAGEPEYVDPAVAALKQEIAELKAAQKTYGESFDRYQQSIHTEQRNSLGAQIERFRSEEGHEYFDVVQPTMTGLIQVARAGGRNVGPADLQEFYDQACWANPAVRAELEARKWEAEQKRRAEEDRKRAERAKAASGSTVGSPTPGATAPDAPALSLQAEVARAWNAHAAGA